MRFEAGLAASAADVSGAVAPLRAAVAVCVAAVFAAAFLAAAADLAVLAGTELERAELAGFDVVGVASAVDCGAGAVEAGMDSSVDLLFEAAFVVRGVEALAVLLVGAAVDFAAAVRGLDGRPPACPDRDTRWSDTPMPVPSAASSS